MGNDIKVYSYNNIEAMVTSVRSNGDIINNMLQCTKKNDREINEILSGYARARKNLGDDQIEKYRKYVDRKMSIEEALNDYQRKIKNEELIHKISSDVYSIDSDYSVLHSVFEKINLFQVKVMEMLCGLLGMANDLLCCL